MKKNGTVVMFSAFKEDITSGMGFLITLKPSSNQKMTDDYIVINWQNVTQKISETML